MLRTVEIVRIVRNWLPLGSGSNRAPVGAQSARQLPPRRRYAGSTVNIRPRGMRTKYAGDLRPHHLARLDNLQPHEPEAPSETPSNSNHVSHSARGQPASPELPPHRSAIPQSSEVSRSQQQRQQWSIHQRTHGAVSAAAETPERRYQRTTGGSYGPWCGSRSHCGSICCAGPLC